MKKNLFIIITLFILLYILIYNFYLLFLGEIIRYIINPLIWISFALIIFQIFNDKRTFKYKTDVIYLVIGSSLLYLIIFYTLGFFIGYTNNPYSTTIGGIIINLFSILLIIGLKEYIRYVLLMYIESDRWFYLLFISIILILSDLNLLVILKSFTSFSSVFNAFGDMVVPIISINIFMTYLCKKGGYLPALIYRTVISLPILIIPIVPDYDWIIPTLFDVLFPLFTYLVIQYMVDKREKLFPKEASEQLNPKNWIITFSLTILIIMFGLGTFSWKPFVIITASMEPNIYPGDLVIIGDSDIESIKPGDIIQYKIKDYSVVHRVINKLEDGNQIILITKGDNNKNKDRMPIKEDQLVGKMIVRIPFIGYPSYLLQKAIGNKKEVDVEIGK